MCFISITPQLRIDAGEENTKAQYMKIPALAALMTIDSTHLSEQAGWPPGAQKIWLSSTIVEQPPLPCLQTHDQEPPTPRRPPPPAPPAALLMTVTLLSFFTNL